MSHLSPLFLASLAGLSQVSMPPAAENIATASALGAIVYWLLNKQLIATEKQTEMIVEQKSAIKDLVGAIKDLKGCQHERVDSNHD